MSSHKLLTPYRNVTEELVIEEIDRQLENLPPEIVARINKSDAITYALNRVPSMYANTKAGYEWQKQRAKESFEHLLSQAAKWGINAAQRPKKLISEPLVIEEHQMKKMENLSPLFLKEEPSEAERVLEKLKQILNRNDLSWENLVAVVQEAIDISKSKPKAEENLTLLLTYLSQHLSKHFVG